MAYMTLLTITLMVTIASGFNFGQLFLAGFPWPDNNAFPGFSNPSVMLRYGPAPVPQMPNFPFNFMNPFQMLPPMAPIKFPPMPPMPSPQDIANAVPADGGSYSGMVVSAQSTSHMNKDGTVTKKGGITSVINDDGKVVVQKTGDSPPDILIKPNPDQNTTQEFDFEDLKIKPWKPHKIPNHFDSFEDFPTIKPISQKKIETYKPEEGEEFVAHSVQSHSFQSNVNGVKKQEASVSKVENINGIVNKETVAYRKGDKPKK